MVQMAAKSCSEWLMYALLFVVFPPRSARCLLRIRHRLRAIWFGRFEERIFTIFDVTVYTLPRDNFVVTEYGHMDEALGRCSNGFALRPHFSTPSANSAYL